MTGPPRPGQRASPRRARPSPDAARRVAFDLMRAVAERDAYANLTLPRLLREVALDARDSAFATELSYGTLRGRGTYDAVLGACVDRPLDRVDPPVLDLLRLGAHQLLAMRVPAHAAVSATVELARAVAGEGRGSFVNAVLRKVARQDLPGWLDQVAPAVTDDPTGHLAVTYSHPAWIVAALRDALGGSVDDTAALLAADNAAPLVTLVARPGRVTVSELMASAESVAARGADDTADGAHDTADVAVSLGRWSPYAVTLRRGDPGAITHVRAGRAGVQDEGSQLVALALAEAPLEGPDRRWLDMCAGPGGKAALLAAVAAARGASLLAAEVAPHRATLVRRVVGEAATVVVADGRAPAWASGSFDRVLLDAPCTGLGALRRRPEARWRRRAEDVAPLVALQRALLASALDAVRPGGLVAYVVCSPHLAETRTVVADVLRSRNAVGGAVEWVDARALLPGVPDLGSGPDLQLWPHLHGTDAMYLALLRRTD